MTKIKPNLQSGEYKPESRGGHINFHMDGPVREASYTLLADAVKRGIQRARDAEDRRWYQALERRRQEVFGSSNLGVVQEMWDQLKTTEAELARCKTKLKLQDELLQEALETLRDIPVTVGESMDLSYILDLLEGWAKSEGLTRASGSE